jgi:dihydrofolate reductase
MGKVIYDISMSLDGFIDVGGEVLHDWSEVLHEWAFNGDGRDRALLERAGASLGAVICGRRTYDNSIRWWGADGPTGAARVPLFIVSHGTPDEVPADGVYTFVGDIHAALDAARSTAGDGDVGIMGGGDIARQFLEAALVDEISIHLAPVLFGSGTRLLGNGSLAEHITLERTDVVSTDAATHLRFRVVK